MPVFHSPFMALNVTYVGLVPMEKSCEIFSPVQLAILKMWCIVCVSPKVPTSHKAKETCRMGTRCQIRIVKNGYPLNYYHHYDGGWNGVGAELRKWLGELGVGGTKVSDGTLVYGLILRMQQDTQYQPTFFRHMDIEFFYLLDFDNWTFKGYALNGRDPWAEEGEDDYDQYKPWYSQLPRHDSVSVVRSIAPRKRTRKVTE